MEEQILNYFAKLYSHLRETVCTGAGGVRVSIGAGFDQVARLLCKAATGDNKIMFVGNGGSASIASHMAIDFSKNGGLRALAFNDSAALTCLGNDLGYDSVFEEQIALQARRGDVLMAISSSGRSANILRAVKAASVVGCDVITYSGFTEDNPLRQMGKINFYLSSSEYGFVEVGHLTLMHGLLDLVMRGVLAPGISPFGLAQEGRVTLSSAGRIL
jgi:D-sedoheptulose 7-phosphate isomerase